VSAIIAFDDLTRFAIPLRHSPWTRSDTRLASDAEGLLNKNYAVFRPALHRTSWARRNAPRILTMKAGHEYEVHARDVPDYLWSYRDDPPESWPDWDIIFCFAVYLTGTAANTFFSGPDIYSRCSLIVLLY